MSTLDLRRDLRSLLHQDPERYADGVALEDYARAEFVKEYRGNPATRCQYPEAFRDADDFVAVYRAAPIRLMSDFSRMHNTDAWEQREGDFSSLSNRLWAYKGKEWTKKFSGDETVARRDYHRFLKTLQAQIKQEPSSLAPPIIGFWKDLATKKETERLLGGNSRANIYRYLGVDALVKRLPLAGPRLPPPDEGTLTQFMQAAEALGTEDWCSVVDDFVAVHRMLHP